MPVLASVRDLLPRGQPRPLRGHLLQASLVCRVEIHKVLVGLPAVRLHVPALDTEDPARTGAEECGVKERGIESVLRSATVFTAVRCS